MPLYKYQCENCNNKFEKFKNMKDRKEDNCPKCESKSRLIFTTFNGHFKGDNFTKTTT